MTALVTGARGFIGRNLVVALRRAGIKVVEVSRDTPPAGLADAVAAAEIIFHLAGVNRPETEAEFAAGNVDALQVLLAAVDARGQSQGTGSGPVVVLSSSTQASQSHAYGQSKLAAEQLLESWAERSGAPAVIYRLPGVFGKWCRPNYNSVVATFCHNVARGLPIAVSDPARVVELVHVDDVVAAFAAHVGERPAAAVTRREVQPVFRIALGDLAARIQAYRDSRQTLLVADAADPLTQRLQGTYLSYVPPADLAYGLAQRVDARGTLAELLKSPRFGQMFVSRTRPGVTRGNHYHDLKVEKFCVLEGDAIIRFRPILGDEVTEHRVSGADFTVVDIPPGMTHSIENVGRGDMVVLFWASEILDPARPDTHPDEVLRGQA